MKDERDDPGIESTARWAFQLGYFLLADRRDARSVLYHAVARLYVTALAQRKRQAKRPKGEVHKKLSLTPRAILQYLIYLCAEPYELAQERECRCGAGALTVDDMIVRYIKHLMLLYLEHNSFYAAVGQSSVLFDLGTSRAGRLYEVLVQGSPAHLETKSDYSVRDAKRELRRRLAGRFGPLVTVRDGARGEQRFVTMADPGAHSRFVRRCLHRLQPSQEEAAVGARCWHLPAGFDPTAYDLVELQYEESNGDPSAEQAAELRRMHAVTHPCCWSRLLRALQYDHSWRRLALPEFTLTSDGKNGRRPPDDRRAPELEASELDGLTALLRSEARRRKGLFASMLSLSVDGSPCGSWSLDESMTVRAHVGADARVLSVSARDEEGELLVAQHLLQLAGKDGSGKIGPATVTLEGGQEFTFTVEPRGHGDEAELVVTISFRETRLHRAAARGLMRAYGRVVAAMPGGRILPTKAWVVVVFGVVLLLALLAGRWLTSRRVNPPTPSVVVVPDREAHAPTPEPGAVPRPSPTTTPPREGIHKGAGVKSRPTEGAAREGAGREESARLVLTLNEGAGQVSLDARGRSRGLEGLPATWRREVETALSAGRVERPAALEAFTREREILLGSPGRGAGASIIGPVGTLVESDRPRFSWRAAAGRASYVVSVFDQRFRPVAQSGPLSVTEWTPPRALRRGATYIWQVKSLSEGAAVVSPSPPLPEARFKVLEQGAFERLERARRLRPGSHLALGVLYARAGLAEEAEREFRALAESNPDSAVARGLLDSVRGWGRSH